MDDKAATLTPQEVAQRLRISLRTTYEHLAEGGPLHHLRIELGPRTVRVNAAGFEAFVRGERAPCNESA